MPRGGGKIVLPWQLEDLPISNPYYVLRGCSSVVERMLPKHDIVGSSPITRFSPGALAPLHKCRGEAPSTFLFGIL